MNERNIAECLCEYFNGAGAGVFMPQVWREGCGAIYLTGDARALSQYVNGDKIVGVEFSLCQRCPGESAKDRLLVMRKFARLADYAKKTPVSQPDVEIVIKNGAKRVQVFKNGEEEYQVLGEIRYLKRRGE